MVKLHNITTKDATGTMVTLVADSSSELSSIGDTARDIVGLEDGTKLAFGSDCMTVAKEYGILGSDKAWHF